MQFSMKIYLCVFNNSNLNIDFHCIKKYARVTLQVKVFE